MALTTSMAASCTRLASLRDAFIQVPHCYLAIALAHACSTCYVRLRTEFIPLKHATRDRRTADMNAEPPDLEGAKYQAEAYPLAVSKELVPGDKTSVLRSMSKHLARTTSGRKHTLMRPCVRAHRTACALC